ncbi:MAG: riboflavin biosynthesis protein RibF [Candidatus Omnitrophica bacterium]|nr:riboflavin biosynthesis protein RibF [Candidatus Omnitrophota bacterium]
MRVINDIRKLGRLDRPVVVLGVFDGVHQGHQKILKAAVTKARAIKGTSVALTFWPHPQKEESLYSLGHRLELIAQNGIDVCVVIEFGRVFAAMKAEDFVKKILIKKIGARYIYVGSNYRFGKGARGGRRLLEKLSRAHGFKLKIFDMIRINHRPISSTAIRKLIKRGDIVRAARLLSRPVSVLGTVVKGDSLARALGFPTANIDPHHEVLPPSGVYAVKIILGKKRLKGISSIGTKPTFKSGRLQHIEVHIFNFRKNIYGKYLEVQFIKKIRGQEKFSSRLALAGQIKKDVSEAKKILSLH